MLNKLNFYRNRFFNQVEVGQPVQAEYGDNVITVLSSLLKQQGLRGVIEPVTGGTLGITYSAALENNRSIFIKTHLAGEKYRLALKKEFQLLNIIYKGTIYLQEVTAGNQTVLLEAKMLIPQMEITPEIALSMIQAYQSKLQCLDETLTPECYGIEDIIDAAAIELPVLMNQGLLSAETSEKIANLIKYVKAGIVELPRCICHGDFGDKNIMQTENGNLIAIDWEDAFWGIADYDYLYWLTFFGHRKYYDKSIFAMVNSDTDLIKGILMMILVIKSAISYYSGSYMQNSLTIEQRMEEMLNLFEDS